VADLLAEASPTPDDQAVVIATWVLGLADDDREYVLEIVKTACDHFARKR